MGLSPKKKVKLLRISQELKNNLLRELEFVILKMREEQDIIRKIYFFSAAYGAVERTVRLSLDNELIMAHAILTICYNSLNDRINRLKAGETIIPISQALFDQLTNDLSDFRQAIEENTSVYPSLEAMMRLTYATTGPGFYTQAYLDYVNSHPT